ncbi:T9SS type A sorting domain-containing protein [Flavobacterium sp. YJ01]|uniref:T9SS type A sorting domain-containing protein n=1 Tax=unclassified Flavobacterium TaxID=196869 RepID=UPI0023E42F78|nr:T9SS type A sorting domain-containing protein [Flavobacterium sp. YJ01]WET05007.1 T9SS type A sorting domain-containing protein [Flavobacterium sp. YJ01]
MKTKLLLLFLLSNFFLHAQYTLIPDANFEKKLIALGIDSGTADGQVLTADVANVTSLSVSTSGISDLTGIQDFTSLQYLNCYGNAIKILDLSKNTNLNRLDCSDNKLISLNLKTGKRATSFELNTTYNYSLECILVDDVALTSNWRKKTDALTKFNSVACYIYTSIRDENFEKKLIALGIDKDGKNGKVITTDIYSVTSLDLSFSGISDLTGLQDFASLKNLNFTGNDIPYFDSSIYPNLESLNCSSNLLKSLNITKNLKLTSLDCSKNDLSSLNLQNGKNTSLVSVNIKSNPKLSCVLVDNAEYSTSNWTNKDVNTSFNQTVCTPEYTLIPDPYFENRLIFLGYDTDGKNGKVQTQNIVYIKSLDLSGSSITNLTGIQDFKSLKVLDCSNNKLKSLDITKNINLEKLEAYSNLIAGTIDISQNLKLTSFNASQNYLTNLDFSKNLALKQMRCYGNLLSDINLTQNLALTGLFIDGNKLTTIDISKNGALVDLYCSENELTSLDLSNNSLLERIYCKKNKLTNINISKNLLAYELDVSQNQLTDIDVSNNKNVGWFFCDQNKLTQLDLSHNINLTWLECGSNLLTSLDFSKNITLDYLYFGGNRSLLNVNLKNGNNKNITRFSSNYNDKLTCILVDDAAYATSKWSQDKDTHIVFSDTPCTLYTTIPDINFENKLIALGIDSDAPDGKILTSKISEIISLDVSSSNITDLSGIQDFTALQDLKCNSNQLKSLNISKNIALINLDCSSNQLINLNVSKNKALKNLNCNSNKLAVLNISENAFLSNLDCHSNLITSLDISPNIDLKSLDCHDNNLATLNLKNGNNKQLIKPNFKNNSNLTCITVDDANYSNSNWMDSKDASVNYNVDCFSNYTLIPDSNFENKLIDLGIDKDGKNGKVLTSSIKEVTSLNVSYSSINSLTGIEAFENLEILNCQNNNLATLNISDNLELKELNSSHNPILVLDVSGNPNLINLNCGFNLLSKLDLSSNPSLKNLDCSSNNLEYLDVSKNKMLVTVDCNSNQIKKLDFSKNPNLTTLNCSSNNLANLNIQNANNIKLSSYNFKLNTKLSCIQVDDLLYSNTNWFNAKDNYVVYSVTACTQYTLIPDQNFENFLLRAGYDTIYNGLHDGKVETANIKSIKRLDMDLKSIEDLTGIQDFEALNYLDCSDNNLTTIDLSKNLSLTYLDCSSNRLTNIDISKNLALQTLKCDNIDNHHNRGLTTIDVSNNLALTYLSCWDSRLRTLDVSNNKALKELHCYYNMLTSLDVSNNKALTNLQCTRNLLTTLDLTNQSALIIFRCHENRLTELNLKNGKNNLLDSKEINFATNPYLTCIQVDDILYSNTNWAGKKDAIATFSTNCGIANSYTMIPDHNFEQKLIDLGIDDVLDSKVANQNINTVIDLDLSNSNITNLKGIENFPALKSLNSSTNNLATLDLSKNANLEILNASSNQITTLDLSRNTKLNVVYVITNPLTNLNIKNGNNSNFILASETAKQFNTNVATTFLGLTTLSCINVDNTAYSNANWSKIKESKTTYSENCQALGIEDSVFDKALVYPNPTKGEVHINNIVLEKANVYNSLGQLVKSFIFNNGENSNTINLSGLPRGVYYVYLINEDAASAKKIILE